jgi:polyketide cyclase/dehydrase/lipid transport protein
MIDIAAPPERVWPVISDVERWHEWTPSIIRVTLLAGGPLALGRRAFIRQPKLPPALWTVTELAPGRSFTWVSRAPGLRVSGYHGVEPIPTGSRATLAVEIDGLLGSLWARLSKKITERYLAYEAAGLKARSENPTYKRDAARV